MSYRIRPRFVLKLQATRSEVIACVREQLENPECPCEGVFTQKHAQLFIAQEQRKVWSPFVSLFIREHEGAQGVEVRGVIGPAPNMWIMFMSGYALLGFLTFVSCMLGISQLIIGQSPTGFYALPVLIVLCVLWISLSQIGQKLAREQIEGLRGLLDRAFNGINQSMDGTDS